MKEKVISSSLDVTKEGPMIDQDKWGAIASLRSRGISKKSIARTLGLHIQTVRSWLAAGGWRPYRREGKPTVMDAHRAWAQARLPQIGYSAVVLHREMVEQRGFRGGYQVVKRFVRPLREERDRQEAATVRFETAPGHQAQVDWGTTQVLIGRQKIWVQIFVMVLGYSRRIFARATLDQKVPALLACHEAAFEHFGGRTREILYDNPKTIVVKREGEEVRWNPVFKDFARYWGYIARLCWPYRARTKGKVESGVKYVKRNFLAGKVFDSLEQLNQELLRWCLEVADRRIHGTTHRVPAEAFAEEGLVPTTGHPAYRLMETPHRTVATDCLVSYQTNRYSVPARLVGRTVDVVVSGEILAIYHGGKRVAEHPVNPGRFQTVKEKGHYAGLFKKRERPPAPAPSIAFWPEVEERPLAVYEQLAEPLLAAGGVR